MAIKLQLGKSVLVSGALLAMASISQATTLHEAIVHTFKTGPDFRIQAQNQREVSEQLRQSYAGYLPVVDFTAGYGRESSNNSTTRNDPNNATPPSLSLWRQELGLAMNQMIFDGFAVKNDVEGNISRLRAETFRTNGTAQDLALDVSASYLAVLRAQELVGAAQENLSNHERIYSQIQKRSDGGIGRKVDLDQAESRLALARANLISEQANLRDARTNFKRFVGIPAQGFVVPNFSTGRFPETEQAAITTGYNANPVLRAAFSDVAVAKASHKAAKAAFVPRVDLETGLTRNYNLDGTRGENDDQFAMLRLRWNLFRGGADQARVCETAATIQEATEVRNRSQREVEQSARLAWNTFKTAQSQKQYFLTYVESTRSTREAYQKQFNIGQRTLLDLLDTENEFFSARTSYVNAKYDALLGQVRVLNAMGILVEEVGVPLPKETEFKVPGVLARTFKRNYKDPAVMDV